ncbi:hypothetical protein [Consotaella aegiceratis]|uniref:hypothetical protein n=1 Tax=Consotaella aegiceratis TaxID=3097961 RepID=UPI002F401B85
MAIVETLRMSEDDVQRIARELLSHRFADYDFQSVSVSAEEDFDGEPILRLAVDVRGHVPAKAVIDAIDAIRETLLARGESRFVFLSTKTSEIDDTDEDELD